MFDVIPIRVREWARQGLLIAVLVGCLCAGAGCGLLGSDDDGDDQKYPEPPGRPGTSTVQATG